MKKIKLIELFGGIGACSKALENLGVPFDIVDYVEIDKYAVKSFNAIHGTNFEQQDITKFDVNKYINENIDIIMHGSPCQDFSVSGKNLGGDKDSGTRSSLMWETVRIVESLKPRVVIWENVKNLISKKHKHNYDAYIKTLDEIGYKSYSAVLNAKDYGIPQNRQRIFTISILGDFEFEFPEPIKLNITMRDLLEEKVDESYYLSDKMLSYMMSTSKNGISRKEMFERNFNKKEDVAYTITTLAGNRASDNFICVKNNTKKGYQEAYDGDGIDLENLTSSTRRGRVQHQSCQTISTQPNKGVVVLGNYSKSNYESTRVVDNNGICPTVKENHGSVYGTQDKNNLRIRKLTPKECWRLMGFSDIDYEKAAQVCSKTQLYKQAGNSIVVNCLYYILRKLIGGE